MLFRNVLLFVLVELASRPCNIVTSQYPVNCSSLIQQAHAMTRATAAHASTLPKRRVFLELWYIRDQISNMNAKQTDMGRSASVKASVPLRTAASSRILLQRLVNAFVTNTSVPNGTTPSSANRLSSIAARTHLGAASHNPENLGGCSASTTCAFAQWDNAGSRLLKRASTLRLPTFFTSRALIVCR
ncbi:hypothetical protein RvY_04244-1 [Ramazzottius varieornatus]|uniref:Secreted protein n=1 Tax=Ramazzottius varieornatus TaxID=947166 RepID=A0A1D1UWR5_RAMVA|nr:hypothetical protein RvY_04244-1 [Ramazzottius varieornatus]